MTGSERGVGTRSPRPAIRSLASSGDTSRLIASEAEIVPWNDQTSNRLVALVGEDDTRLALICTSLSYGRGQLEYMELWEVPADLDEQDLSRALSDVSEMWQPLVKAAELTWGGIESAVVEGGAARKAICALDLFAAPRATLRLFDAWDGSEEDTALERAKRATSESIDVMKTSGKSDLELGGELSASLSRLGFLQSLDDDSLGDAQLSLEEAKRIGSADRWVTDWNLANVSARQGDDQAALRFLDKAEEAYVEPLATVSILLHLPGRPAKKSIAVIGAKGMPALFKLQRALISAEDGRRQEAIEACRDSEDPAALAATAWVEQALAQPA
jgi:hypothetical protein